MSDEAKLAELLLEVQLAAGTPEFGEKLAEAQKFARSMNKPKEDKM